jgi:hypothetical protein
MTGSAAGAIGTWAVRMSPMEGDVERIALWIQVTTGFELDANGSFVALDAQSWKERRTRLAALGGPPAER